MAGDAARALAGEDPRILRFLDALADAIAEDILRDLAGRSGAPSPEGEN